MYLPPGGRIRTEGSFKYLPAPFPLNRALNAAEALWRALGHRQALGQLLSSNPKQGEN